MTALVLSAGGMFGAYQAGAWKVLSEIFRPDLIVGASIGAVNGWAIAGGCEPDELIRRWLNLEEAAKYRWKIPSGIFGGVLDSRPLQRAIRHIHESYPLRIEPSTHTEFAMVVTDLVKLRPRIVPGREVTWQHLVATTAIVGIFDQIRLGGRLTSDGGLLSAVPLWAAAELGAQKAVVIDVLPEPPGLVAKTFVGAMRMLSPFRAIVPPGIEVIRIAPPALLGRPLESLYWSHRNAARWIAQGQEDASRVEHSIVNCFERE
jgi:NTE family protein